mmetsp:Transcript_102883/g.286524  ORF Transcript_102883/g.286524 Transcript_102883/m.286524 type:complete len:284 (+) Transcript_102883:217-1068(+)
MQARQSAGANLHVVGQALQDCPLCSLHGTAKTEELPVHLLQSALVAVDLLRKVTNRLGHVQLVGGKLLVKFGCQCQKPLCMPAQQPTGLHPPTRHIRSKASEALELHIYQLLLVLDVCRCPLVVQGRGLVDVELRVNPLEGAGKGNTVLPPLVQDGNALVLPLGSPLPCERLLSLLLSTASGVAPPASIHRSAVSHKPLDATECTGRHAARILCLRGVGLHELLDIAQSAAHRVVGVAVRVADRVGVRVRAVQKVLPELLIPLLVFDFLRDHETPRCALHLCN